MRAAWPPALQASPQDAMRATERGVRRVCGRSATGHRRRMQRQPVAHLGEPSSNLSGVEVAERLMNAFAERTGLEVLGDPTRRYLWTDAFAVRTLLVLHERTGREVHLARATRLLDLVHARLGRHRGDDGRIGWISGLDEHDGSNHPTAGGLRIGKLRPERMAGEPFDERLEWERDGQYFHYLTQWMHALERFAEATDDPHWIRLAIELVEAACRGFARRPFEGASPRLAWKMSIDLSRALVDAPGHLDPLDGFVAARRVAATAARLEGSPRRDGVLASESAMLRMMCDRTTSWSTLDPLGLGGLLVEGSHLVELIAEGSLPPDPLLGRVLVDALRSLRAVAIEHDLARPLEGRLAFRELGLAIGLRSVAAATRRFDEQPGRFEDGRAAALRAILESMNAFVPLASSIERSWMDPAAPATRAWSEHRDIDEVMLAASLVAG